jgi:hypothetical protein
MGFKWHNAIVVLVIVSVALYARSHNWFGYGTLVG